MADVAAWAIVIAFSGAAFWAFAAAGVILYRAYHKGDKHGD